jgi:hypothetical protein
MTPEEYMAQYTVLAAPQTTRRDAMARQYEAAMSPEAQEKSRKEDLYTMLAQIGFGMAGTNSPSFLQAAGQAANAAIPGAVQARKERKAEQRQGMAALADIENMSNADRKAAADYARAQRERAEAIAERRWSVQEEQDFKAEQAELERKHDFAILRATPRGGGGGSSNSADNFERDVMEEFRILKNVAPTGGVRAGDAELMQRARQRVAQRRDLISRANVSYLQARGAPETEEPNVEVAINRATEPQERVRGGTPVRTTNWGD